MSVLLNDQNKIDNIQTSSSVCICDIVEEIKPEPDYTTFLESIKKLLDRPKTKKQIEESLHVPPNQLKNWLERAVEDSEIEKTKKPVQYKIPNPSLDI